MYHPEMKFIVYDISLYYDTKERGNFDLKTFVTSIFMYPNKIYTYLPKYSYRTKYLCTKYQVYNKNGE